MARQKKDRFADLDQDFAAGVEGMTAEEIRAEIAKAALYKSELDDAKKSDGALQDAYQAYREAGALYREAAKDVKLRIDYCREILSARGAA